MTAPSEESGLCVDFARVNHYFEDYDRGEKSKLYRSIPTMEEYVLIDQHSVHVEQFYLETARKWIFMEYNQLTEALHFAKIEYQISLQDVYRRIAFSEIEEARH